MLKEVIDLNETLMRTIDLLYAIVEHNNIWIHMLKEAIDLNETLVRTIDLLYETVEYNNMNTYVERSDWSEWDSPSNYWFVIWDCGI